MYTIPYKKKLNQVKHPTIKDVAEKAGVSTTTVLRVLHNNGYVSKETRAKVLEAIDLTGYHFNMIAHSLKKNVTRVIGHIIVGHYFNPFFARVAYSVESAANKKGYHVISYFSYGDPKREAEAVDLFISRRVEGIIFTTPLKEENIYKVMSSNIPVVMIERPLKIPVGDYVLVDNFSGVYEAVKYLISMGHKKIGFIGVNPNRNSIISSDVEAERFDGYRQAMLDSELEIEPELIKLSSDYTVEEGFQLGKELLSLKDFPSAIFVTSDITATGIMQAIYEERLRVPEDISIVGFDDALAMYTAPPLTTVAQPFEEMGEVAINLIIDRLRDKNIESQRRVILKPELVIRNSVNLFSEEVSSRRGY
jgi:DNA-binding LacI/PurR family transcriptional regulator